MFINLHTTDKALFIVHLAIGDYTYMQRCFEKLKAVYPHLQIDLFIQDHRRTTDVSKWKHLDNYILYEWLESSQLFGKIYKTYSPQLLETAIKEAKAEHYPLVISLGDLRSQNYSALAKEIAQDQIAVGIDIETTIFHLNHRRDLNKLDIRITDLVDKSQHISQKFAHWFEQIADLQFQPEELYPEIAIPHKWQEKIDLQLQLWKPANLITPTVFINIYAKGEERCWKPEQALALIKKMQETSRYQDALYILNIPPEAESELKKLITEHQLENSHTFCANESFFELPALLKRCDLIITVDTSIMHLACISDAVLISLIRKKRPNDIRWTPLKAENSHIVYTPNNRDPMSAISVNSVLQLI